MRKILIEKCSSGNLRGLIVDWSDAQIKVLQLAIGNEKAEMLLKGCKVHWIRSCHRVAEKVAFSCDRQKERTLFVHVARQIPYESCDWTAAKQWWTRSTHLKMLSRVFSSVPESWRNCPTTTNAVERKDYECKTDRPQPLKLAMINLYKLDKGTCCKHIASENGASISYRSKMKRLANRMLRIDVGNVPLSSMLIEWLSMAHLTAVQTFDQEKNVERKRMKVTTTGQ